MCYNIINFSNEERYATLVRHSLNVRYAKGVLIIMFLHNHIITDNRIKLQDIGLLAVLKYRNINFFSENGLTQLVPTHSRTSIRTSIKRLEDFGYLSRIRIRDKSGKFSYCQWELNYLPHLKHPPKSESSSTNT